MDIRVFNHGSVVRFTPVSDAGRDFLKNDLESEGWQWLGGSLVVDHRFADDIIGLANNECLEVSL